MRHEVHHRAKAVGVRITRRWIDEPPAADGVVDDDQRSRAGECERVLEVKRAVPLVRIDEDHVERCDLCADERLERVRCGADDDFGSLRKSSPREVLTRDQRALGIDLERDQSPVRRQRARKPDRAVAGERADLEDPPRADRTREHLQRAPLCGRDRDRRHLRAFRRRRRAAQGRIFGTKPVLERAIDLEPEWLRFLRVLHGGTIATGNAPCRASSAQRSRRRSPGACDIAGVPAPTTAASWAHP